jgi:hypothetical protein
VAGDPVAELDAALNALAAVPLGPRQAILRQKT